ncbi:hypothetical protein EXU57_01055 [Segetibacter sp. 3557_3]|uniref:hypothetical protein n=1 Tax=Segetibacter sp. 3557_3 TaxID=2547429 RepID=UPI001058B75D|nr:hypothetical protein [Segetibacter sp. 3557_3]TDH28696.1 hypothetical protein EXU57_01055 [Segetibacter sp. 3557_3]
MRKKERDRRKKRLKTNGRPGNVAEDETEEMSNVYNRFNWIWVKRVEANGKYSDEPRAISEWKDFENSDSRRSQRTLRVFSKPMFTS